MGISACWSVEDIVDQLIALIQEGIYGQGYNAALNLILSADDNEITRRIKPKIEQAILKERKRIISFIEEHFNLAYPNGEALQALKEGEGK